VLYRGVGKFDGVSIGTSFPFTTHHTPKYSTDK
jgi:hypothetical protein